MKILITGCAGFIGSHLTEFLLKKKSVKKIIGVDYLQDGSKKNMSQFIKNKKFIFKKKDITKLKQSEKFFKNIDIVIHLAALSDVVPSIIYAKEYENISMVP